MPRARDWKQRLAEAMARADLGAVSLREAARMLEEAVPDYAEHRYQGSGCDGDGVRWFEAPQLAIAHAVWAATHRPYDPDWRVVDVVGELSMSERGWWSSRLRLPVRRHPQPARLHS
ncbi:MAG TPA: hypothetical protein VD865_17565 [Stenotrophomonas sp.]|nr:hypothetical protein [Stenotrophomonas sp.]